MISTCLTGTDDFSSAAIAAIGRVPAAGQGGAALSFLEKCAITSVQSPLHRLPTQAALAWMAALQAERAIALESEPAVLKDKSELPADDAGT